MKLHKMKHILRPFFFFAPNSAICVVNYVCFQGFSVRQLCGCSLIVSCQTWGGISTFKSSVLHFYLKVEGKKKSMLHAAHIWEPCVRRYI